MSLHTAKVAMEENVAKYVNSKTDPGLYNISIALKHIAMALEELTTKADRLARQQDALEARLRSQQ